MMKGYYPIISCFINQTGKQKRKTGVSHRTDMASMAFSHRSDALWATFLSLISGEESYRPESKKRRGKNCLIYIYRHIVTHTHLEYGCSLFDRTREKERESPEAVNLNQHVISLARPSLYRVHVGRSWLMNSFGHGAIDILSLVL